MQKFDFIVSGYSGVNYILKVKSMPRIGVTEIVQNADNSTSFYGGNGLNTVYYIARLGMRPLLLMRGGSDYEALGFEKFFEQNGISRDGITRIQNDITPVCYLVEDSANDHLTLFYPGSMDGKYAPKEYPKSYFERSSFALMTVASTQDNKAFLRGVKSSGIPLAFAMRADPDAFPNDFLNEILHESELVFMNESERGYIRSQLGYDPTDELIKNGRAKVVVTTLGPDGCLLFERENGVKKTAVPATRPNVVLDATGAGDSFLSGFLYGHLKGANFVQCAEYGSTTASFIVEEVGCLTNVPTEQEMLNRNDQRRGGSK